MTPAQATLRKLRTLYASTWNREWPFDDTYLTTLYLEARASHNATTARVPPQAVWPSTLTLMRESHDFEPVLPHLEPIHPCQL